MDGNKGPPADEVGEPQTLPTRDAARCRHRQNQEHLSSTVFDLEGKKKYRFFLPRLMIFSIIAQITLVCEAESGTWITIQKTNNNENTC